MSHDTEKSKESSVEPVDEFAIMAHDLKEPLRKIRGFGQILASDHSDELSEAGRKYVVRIQSAVNRMQSLLDELLNLSKASVSDRPLVTVDLEAVLSEVIGDLDYIIDESQARIKVRTLPSVKADPYKIRQLFMNLLINAIKFRKPGESAKVVVWAESQGSECTIFIKDSGIGFEESKSEFIFVPFQRLHGRHEYDGVGLGLAICRKIVHSMNGTIGAHGVPGEGSVFEVTLPRAERKGGE